MSITEKRAVLVSPLPVNPACERRPLNGTAGMIFAPDFVRGSNHLYTSMDPRTIDVPRNTRIAYDRPPYQTPNTQPLQHLYTSQGSHTGYYPRYQDIHAGQILYYTDLSIADPYGNPVYVIPSYSIPTLLQDPMGALRPYYEKVPVLQDNFSLSEYSFDRDQMQFREDLMAKQSEKMNSNDWQMYQLFENAPQSFCNP